MEYLSTVQQIKLTLWNLTYNNWKTEELFSVQWWSLITIIAISYIVWWKLVDKQRIIQIVLFGSLVSVGRIVMDIVGNNLVLWSYDIRVLPMIPIPFIHDFTISPLIYMLGYQYFTSWKTFSVFNIATTGSLSFIFLPLLSISRVLNLYNWNYFYTFILVIFITSLSRAVMLWLLHLEQKYEVGYSRNQSMIPNLQPVMKPLVKKSDDNED
jgi:hypothetical protein